MKDLGKIINPVRKIAGAVLPFFSRYNLEDIVSDASKDPELKSTLSQNPRYYDLLEQSALQMRKKYKGPVYWGKVIDSWDRITSGASVAGSLLFPGVGEIGSVAEEVIESVPKALYSAYYALKTHDFAAIPYWLAYELASFLPFNIGDALDFKNIYLNRAKRKFQEAVKKRFFENLSGLRAQMQTA